MADKSQIIRNIKNALGFKNDSEFAKYLGISPQTLATWHTRNSINIELIYAKCENIDANYLLTGEGKMFRNKSENSTEETEKTTQTFEEVTSYLLKRVKDLEEELSDLKVHHGSDDVKDVDRGSYKKTGNLKK